MQPAIPKRAAVPLLAAALLVTAAAAPAWTDDDLRGWLKASAAEERRRAMPAGLLRAIALVESGRGGRPHPWTLNVRGRALYFPSRAAAAAALSRAPERTDVGMMQINLRWHGARFASPAEALDPARNLEAAADFLAELKTEHGTWTAAVERYHSSRPGRRRAYVCKVYATLAALHRRQATAAARAYCAR